MNLGIKVDALSAIRNMGRRVKEITTTTGALSDAIREGGEELRDEAEKNTHRLTGALASSHKLTFDTGRNIVGRKVSFSATITPDAAVINPLTRKSVITYAVHEHNRGGEHAFYDITRAGMAGRVKLKAMVNIRTALK